MACSAGNAAAEIVVAAANSNGEVDTIVVAITSDHHGKPLPGGSGAQVDSAYPAGNSLERVPTATIDDCCVEHHCSSAVDFNAASCDNFHLMIDLLLHFHSKSPLETS